MAQPNIFQQLQSDTQAKQKLEQLAAKQMEIASEDKQALSDYESNLQKMLKGDKTATVESLAKIDKSIERGKQFKGEISDLTESLTQELQDLGQFFGGMSQYRGLETFLSQVGLTRWADKKRFQRVKHADVKENLQTILDLGNGTVKQLYGYTVESMEKHAKVHASIQLTGKKLEENQPIYEKWRTDRESYERQVNALQDKMDKADASEFAKLAEQKTELDKKLQEAKINETNFFTIVDKAKQALPIQRTHLKAYADIVESLVQLRTGLEQNIENVTQLYLAVPTAIKIALGTKAASQYDKGMKYATDQATATLLESAQGILDESANRAERPLIEQDKLEAYRKAQMEMRADFERRTETIKARYAAPGSNSK